MKTMSVKVPRILLAGVSSGCGKTTVTCAILQALCNRGMKLHSFKCGPDYIDPMFHERVIGTRSSNLDLFFYEENTLKYLLAKNGRDADLSVLEGVMGYYDGLGVNTYEKSTYEVAKKTATPTILVVNGKGMSFSVIALIKGFLEMVPDSRIFGVILNNVTASTYALLKTAIEEAFENNVKPLGYLPTMKDCAFESRHLGLITAAEISDIKEKLSRLAEQTEKSIDLDGIVSLANECEEITYTPVMAEKRDIPVRIGVAWDKAFCFYYRDNLELLKELGAELCYFSPLSDPSFPDCDALYLGGGYPELYLEELSSNTSILKAVRQAIANGMPCIAECGGFMYLTESIEDYPMAAVLPGKCENQGKLTRFGYITLTAKVDNLLCNAGDEICAHEFHHYDAEQTGDAFIARKKSGKMWEAVFAHERLYAGYPHLPFYSNPRFAENFCKAAEAYRKERES